MRASPDLRGGHLRKRRGEFLIPFPLAGQLQQRAWQAHEGFPAFNDKPDQTAEGQLVAPAAK
jgi:hypothetical protein